MSMKLAKERESRILGISTLGRPIFGISGAEPDDDGNGNGNGNGSGGDGGGNGGDGGGEGGSGEGDPSGSGGSGNDGGQPRSYSQEEMDTIMRRLRAADEAKGRAEKRIREMDDAERSELEKAQNALKDANERIKKLEGDAVKAKMANAILQFPGFTWHDPEVVLQVIDMDLIEIDEESGKVKGIKTALDKLAKDKPYLLKGKQDSNGNGSGNNGGPNGGNGSGSGSSGHNPNGGKPDDKNARRKELIGKYPQLRR